MRSKLLGYLSLPNFNVVPLSLQPICERDHKYISTYYISCIFLTRKTLLKLSQIIPNLTESASIELLCSEEERKTKLSLGS